MKLTLVTLNTWKGEGDYPSRLIAMGDLLEKLNPDLVFLQEVLAVPGSDIDTARTLAERVGFRTVSHPARRKPRRIGGEVCESTSGLAMLTRLELRAAKSVTLPTDPADGERIAQVAEFDTGMNGVPPLVAVNLHLSHLPDARKLRQSQFAAVHNSIGTVQGATVVFAGDFNDDPDDQWIADAVSDPDRTVRNGRDDPGMPDRSSTLVGLPTQADGECIDHFLCASQTARFTEISHHGDGSVSDHLAVRAVIDCEVTR